MNTYAQLRLASESYAIPIAHVVEIATLGDLTPIPGARHEIVGVRNLRGQILPVIDLAQLLGLNPVAPPRQLLVAESGSIMAGFAIDEVNHVGELPDPSEGAESDFLLGTMIHDGELLAVINVPRIFSSLQPAEV
jgi:chemotaxis signal transduction protein